MHHAGKLSASVFSTVFGTLFPGEGTIYLKQSLDFLKPMYVDTDCLAEFTIKKITKNKNGALVDTITKQKTATEVICISVEALIMNKAIINSNN